MTELGNIQWVPIGKILREHGVHGECKIALFNGCAPSLCRGLACTAENAAGQVLQGKLIKFRVADKFVIAHFDFFSNPEMILSWRGAIIKIPAEMRKRPAADFLFDDEWVGMRITDAAGLEIGTVERVDYSPLQLLLLRSPAAREILIPVVPAWLVHLDKVQKCVAMNLPEGLVEI